jgi:hypothetical protein
VLERLLPRAFRRPVAPSEVERFLAVAEVARGQGADVHRQLGAALHAVLLSSNFLFRVELDPASGAGEPRALDDHELATRLSYFLWSSMPDEALFTAAERKRLTDEGELRGQVARMLADGKAVALVDDFAGQWLTTRELSHHTPDPRVFGSAWSAELATSMQKEVTVTLLEFLRTDRPVAALISSPRTHVDARLARHYGLKAPAGEGFQEVDGAGQRGGVLRLGATLTVTSSPVRTSPIERGKWVLESLLCAPPPPPPPVTALPDAPMSGMTLRQRLEAHRAAPTCRPCHELIDPLGFGLENYDAIGRWRVRDGAAAVDPSGTLPDGRRFSGPQEMIALVAADPRFASCVARQVFTYALGRGPTDADGPVLEDIEARTAAAGGSLRALVAEVAASAAFRRRRPEGAVALAGGAP